MTQLATPTAATTTVSSTSSTGSTPSTRLTGAVSRRLAVAGLAVGATLNTAEAVLGQLLPQRPELVHDQLVAVSEHTALYGARAVIGTLAVPFMAIGFLAAAQVLGSRYRRLGRAAATLLLSGMWGFVGIHLMGLLQVPASRSRDLAAAADVLTSLQSDPALGLLFMAPFLVGTVAGMLLLTVGLLRAHVLPRWIPALWLVFIVVDFTVGAVGPIDPHWLFLAGAFGMAAHVARSGAVNRRNG